MEHNFHSGFCLWLLVSGREWSTVLPAQCLAQCDVQGSVSNSFLIGSSLSRWIFSDGKNYILLEPKETLKETTEFSLWLSNNKALQTAALYLFHKISAQVESHSCSLVAYSSMSFFYYSTMYLYLQFWALWNNMMIKTESLISRSYRVVKH